MKTPLAFAIAAGLSLGGAFYLGQVSARPSDLHAQGRGPVRKPTPKPEPRTRTPLVYDGGGGGGGTASANGYIAVTGSYGVGNSVLYLIDTNRQQLSVYEARGGTETMRRIVWVGSRRIDLDMEVLGYNDESPYGYKELQRLLIPGKKARRPATKRISLPAKPLRVGESRTGDGR